MFLYTYLLGLYVLYAVCATAYFIFTNFWTAVRYGLGVGIVIYIGTPEMLPILYGDTSFVGVAASLIWMHLGGAILCPYIFFFTVLPVMLYMKLKK